MKELAKMIIQRQGKKEDINNIKGNYRAKKSHYHFIFLFFILARAFASSQMNIKGLEQNFDYGRAKIRCSPFSGAIANSVATSWLLLP